jgi:hypothetical protein
MGEFSVPEQMESWFEDDPAGALAARLIRCADVCDEALQTYHAIRNRIAYSFVGSLLFAAAAIRRAAASEPDDPTHCIALHVAGLAATEAAAAARAHGFDPLLLRCADACDRAAYLCSDALRQLAPHATRSSSTSDRPATSTASRAA